jgi:hypothetical protein
MRFLGITIREEQLKALLLDVVLLSVALQGAYSLRYDVVSGKFTPIYEVFVLYTGASTMLVVYYISMMYIMEM